jgi:hypothetical protein
MSRAALLLLSMLIMVLGLIWTFQGLGYLGGSAMSGQHEWAVIGPAVAGLGVALMIVVISRPHE